MRLSRGAVAKDRSILAVRELVREDLSALKEKRALGPAVARFRDPHHRLARLFAVGLRYEDICAKSGYSYNRISSLARDPAFQDLIASYRDKVDKAFVQSVLYSRKFKIFLIKYFFTTEITEGYF